MAARQNWCVGREDAPEDLDEIPTRRTRAKRNTSWRKNPRSRRRNTTSQNTWTRNFWSRVLRFEMAGRLNWCVGREDAPEDFDELLRDTDSEDEGEAEYLLEEEPEEQEAEYDEPEYLDQEFLEPGPEYVEPPPTILGLYTQEGVEVPLSSTASSPMENLTASVPHPSSSALAAVQASSPLRAAEPFELRPEHVVITLEEGDIDALGDQFHLADEHLQFEQEAEPVERLQPVRGRGCPRRRGRGCARGARGGRRGRGQGRGQGPAGEPQWQKGDRLIEVHMNDDDVPEDLRAKVMRMMDARLATRDRAIATARRQVMADGEVHEDEEWLYADDGQDEEAYVPSQNICIDESLTLWKGNLKFRQYIKTKAAKFGVKTYELCESSTGYLWSFFVYLGKATTYDPTFPSTLLKSTATVLTLIHPILSLTKELFRHFECRTLWYWALQKFRPRISIQAWELQKKALEAMWEGRGLSRVVLEEDEDEDGAATPPPSM
ncbi:hypothetical protein PYW07_000095 [Mythimna separata]|uniref:PiggyBac transposable element-derived protein domain-containing protein n=1 Tax=Mythimna separata TaxID=271217 RepID=A0AAD8E0S7_MYTSE|nr:hypothetical protein PYW07_000095 [Mythimna separata]